MENSLEIRNSTHMPIDRHHLICLEARLYIELGIRGRSHGGLDGNLPGCLYRGYVHPSLSSALTEFRY